MSTTNTPNTPATRANGALTEQKPNAAAVTVRSLLSSEAYKKRFEEVLGQRAPQFLAAITAAASMPHLAKAEPRSVIAAAFTAASMNLSISPALGQAHIVPYSAKGSQPVAQFQMGYKGYIQLALRTGQYRAINDFVVYEGELESYNPMSGELVYKPENRKSDKVIGYAFYFELLNGFQKVAYWPKAKVEDHAKRYSKSYGSAASPWKSEFDAMALKTVIGATLRKYGILSVEMAQAVENDGASRGDLDAVPIFPDLSNALTAGGGSNSDPDAPLVGATGGASEGDAASSETDGLGEPPQA